MTKSGRFKRKKNIICPHCDYNFVEDDFDVDGQMIEPYSDNYTIELDCLNCDNKFEMTLHLKTRYTTRVV